MSNMVKKAYHGGAFYSAIGEDFSALEKSEEVIGADILDAWYPPSPKVLGKVTKFLPFIFRSSSPTHSSGLIKTIAERRDIPIKNIAVGGGSSAIMFTLFSLLLTQKSRVLILDPMYGEYQHIFEHVIGASIIRHMLHPDTSFVVDADKLLHEVQTHKPDMVVIVNPNSPTGQYWDRESIRKFLSAIPQETMLLIDETYIEYVSDDASMEKDVLLYPNLLVLKSMSKIYALSGARVGYVVASENIIETVTMHTPPWSVSHFGQIAAVEALNDWQYYRSKIDETVLLRSQMIQALRDVTTIDVFESVGNYFLIRLHRHSADAVVRRLQESHIFLRNCDSMSVQFKDNFIRIAVKDRSTNEKVVAALRSLIQ